MAFAAAAIPLASVSTIAVKFGLQVYPGVGPHPHAPSISSRVMPVCFAFTTISTATSFTDYRQFVEFIDGPQPSVAIAASPSWELDRIAAEIEAERRQQRQEIRARAVLANQR